MTGRIIKSTGSDYLVRTEDGVLHACKVKGNFRIRGIRSTNPLAVGDIVDFDGDFIYALHDRKNYIVRRPVNLSKQLHIIAANLDQTALIVTISQPELDTTFVDRFLATAEAYSVPAMLVFNKTDLLSNDERDYLQAVMYLYQSIGYRCIAVSATQGTGLDMLRKQLHNSITLLSGNSGVGKSTLINMLIPDSNAQIGPISTTHLKGMHTTTFSEMYIGPDNIYLIDTPGIKGFGMVDMKVEEVGHYFPEIFATARHCRFNNCTHCNEPDCAVLKAVDEEHIAWSRYNSYRSIIDEIGEGKYR